jgi:hypothetical protein
MWEYKIIEMYLAVIQILIVMILIFLTLIIVGVLYWSTPSQSSDALNYLDSDIKVVRDVITNDSYLHRLLMIEIINKDKTLNEPSSTNDIAIPTILENSPIDSQHSSELITFRKISNGIDLLGRSLVRSFGGAISQRVTLLMHQRNNVIRDYYRAMRDVVCNNGRCVHIVNVTSDDPETKNTCIIRPLTSTDSFPSYINNPTQNSEENIIASLDITTSTLRRLEVITRDVADNIAAAFHIKDIDETNLAIGRRQYNKRPIIHYERLFNLMTMYDKELLNQAKSYASKQYDISMNCAQSSLDITRHISEEFNILMRDGVNETLRS